MCLYSTDKSIKIKTIIILYSSLNPEGGTPEILILRQLKSQVTKFRHGYYPNPVSPTLTSSAMRTPGPKSDGPSASLVETEETSESTEWDLDAPEATAEGDIQI
jgi:hypothetical protein